MSGYEGYAQPTSHIGRKVALSVGAVALIAIAGAGGVFAAKQANRPTAHAGAAAPALSSTPSPNASSSLQPMRTPAPATAKPTKLSTRSLPQAGGAVYERRYWEVFLAVAGTKDDPRIAQARRQAQAVGYPDHDIYTGNFDCSGGARTGLQRAGVRLDPKIDYTTVSLVFSTRQDAATFVDIYQPGLVATVQITWLCAG